MILTNIEIFDKLFVKIYFTYINIRMRFNLIANLLLVFN